jgi:hypothetical protein
MPPWWSFSSTTFQFLNWQDDKTFKFYRGRCLMGSCFICFLLPIRF